MDLTTVFLLGVFSCFWISSKCRRKDRIFRREEFFCCLGGGGGGATTTTAQVMFQVRLAS